MVKQLVSGCASVSPERICLVRMKTYYEGTVQGVVLLCDNAGSPHVFGGPRYQWNNSQHRCVVGCDTHNGWATGLDASERRENECVRYTLCIDRTRAKSYHLRGVSTEPCKTNSMTNSTRVTPQCHLPALRVLHQVPCQCAPHQSPSRVLQA